MQSQIDRICNSAGVWRRAFLSGHANNYQRFTRTRTNGGTQIPYVICGNGGHNVVQLAKGNQPLRTPQVVQPANRGADLVVLEN